MPTDIEYLGRAEDIAIFGEEDGFELHFTTGDGEYVVNVHAVLGALLEEVTREIVSFLAEGEAARAARPVTDDDTHSVHADIWDTREGK